MMRLWLLALVPLLLCACAAPAPPPVDPLAALRRADGTVVWQEEYAFLSPPAPWSLVSLDEDDYSIAFAKECSDYFPCQSTMAYAEEPFGYSKDFDKRAPEFFKRFLWASRVVFGEPKLEPATFDGKPALVARVEGKERVKGQKVWAKVVFARRGDRVVGFYYTQWRPEQIAYDPVDEQAFDAFVDSFKFVKPSFYEQL